MSTPRPSTSKGKVYALLIGIDKFQYFVNEEGDLDLYGCVRDSREIERYLKETVSNPKKQLFLRKLRSIHPDDIQPADLQKIPCAVDETLDATRETIIDSFLNFLTKAGKDDVVMLHYSGHGSFEYRPQELHHLDTPDNVDHRGETIICQDAYIMEGNNMIPPIRDFEMRWMLHKVAEKGAHIVTLMDCCNSSGNTRNMRKETVKVRFSDPKDPKRRAIQDFVFYQKDKKVAKLLDDLDLAKQFQIPQGRHVALYACHSYELAKEDAFPEGSFGVFTYYLLQTLRATKGNISYRDLIKLVRSKTASKVSYQSPQSYAVHTDDMNLQFLGGGLTDKHVHYTVRKDKKGQYIMDAGTLNGIPPEKEGQTWINLFSAQTDVQKANPSTAIRAYLSKVGALESVLAFEEGVSIPGEPAFMKAIVTATPLEKTKVCIVTEINEEIIQLPDTLSTDKEKAVAKGAEILQTALGDSKYVQLVSAKESWDFRLFAYHFEGKEKYRIAQKDDIRAIVEPRTGFKEKTAKALVKDLDHIARWEKTLHLENKHNPVIKPGDVELVVMDPDNKEITDDGGTITLDQKQNDDGSWTAPQLKFKAVMKNKKQVPLYCALLYLANDFSINPSFFPADAHLGKLVFTDGHDKIEREQWEVYAGSQHVEASVSVNTGLEINFEVPDSFYNQGIHEVEDHFKLIVSTEQFDPLHLHQGALEEATSFRSTGQKKVNSQLDALMKEVNTRAAGFNKPKKTEKVTDWWTTLVTVKTRRGEPS